MFFDNLGWLWNNVSNTTAGFTPGQLGYFSFGVPFVDPGPGDISTWDRIIGWGAEKITDAMPVDGFIVASLNVVDQFYAGFADGITLGLSTKAREWMYGDIATRNHQGAYFESGRFAQTDGIICRRLVR